MFTPRASTAHTSPLRSRASFVEALEQRIAPAAAIFDLGSVNGTNGFKINGVAANDGAGVAVSAAGDVNHDGFQDFIVGARGADPGAPAKSAAGETYVVFGKAGGFGASFDLSTINGTNGFKISGEAVDDFSGSTVSRAGDVNGDGFDDLIVGAYGNDPGAVTGAGAVYLIYGKRNGFTANLDLSSPTVTKIAGASVERFGLTVSAAGDVNHDGRDDLIIGAPDAGSFAGASYVIFGKRGGLGASFSLASLNGANGFKITGAAAGDYAGRSVSGAGDVNGDGFDDLIVGAYSATTNAHSKSGAAYVIFGKRRGFTATLALSSLNGANGFKLNGEAADDYAGRSVSGAGDVNGDGFDDLLIGADNASKDTHTQNGAAYVVFGKRRGFTASLDLSALSGAQGFKIYGQEDFAQLGSAVSAAGDLNADGFDDFLVGADRANPNTDTAAGSAYAIFGKRNGFTTNLSLASLNGLNGFRINGDAAGDRAGFALAAAGDLNGDGFGDLLVGAPDLSGPAGTGAAYAIFGQPLPVKISKNGRSATLLDGDGDLITVRTNKGAFSQDDFTTNAQERNLLRLNLSDDGTEFQGASIVITAKKPRGGTGDGKANVGAIDATGIDLRSVVVASDLGQIDSGDANLLTPGLGKLSVGSLGVAIGSQPVGTLDELHSRIVGKFGSLKSGGSVKGFVEVIGALGSVSIGGSLDGSAAGATAGLLRTIGDIGKVSVKGSILGGADASGLDAGAKLGRVSIGGDLSSAAPAKPAAIFAKGKTSPLNAKDAVAIAGVTVKGNVLNAKILANPDPLSNQTNSNAALGSILVRGNWTASHAQSTGNLGNVTVVGNFTGDPTHGLVGGIKMGRVSIGGNLTGASTASQVIICAVGKLGGLKTADALAIASVTVKGNVENAGILGGYSPTLGAASRDASIGAVLVGGTWKASNLVAGVSDATQNGFGLGDTPILGNNTALIAKIASVTIKGLADGSGVGGHFGITAEKLVSVKIAGVKQALTSGVDNLAPNPAPLNPNFRLVEV